VTVRQFPFPRLLSQEFNISKLSKGLERFRKQPGKRLPWKIQEQVLEMMIVRFHGFPLY
jgi:hypothetical protein